MDEERTANPELAERLQRLQARSASRGAPQTRDLEVAPDPSPAGRGRNRRTHAAPRARIVAGSLTASAFLVGVTSLIANEQPWTPATAPTIAPVAPVHRVVYVDQNGNPIDPSALPAVVDPAAAPPPTDVSPAGAPPPGPAPSGAIAVAPAPSAPAPDPVAVPSPAADTGTPPPTTPPPATAPPPTTVATTTTTAPPPPPPPACSGSTCPN